MIFAPPRAAAAAGSRGPSPDAIQSQQTDHAIMRLQRTNPNIELRARASGTEAALNRQGTRHGQLKNRQVHDIMALSAEDKYRFALRVIGFACTTFYVFIYGFALSLQAQ